jgi:FkbM family methyltransferase
MSPVQETGFLTNVPIVAATCLLSRSLTKWFTRRFGERYLARRWASRRRIFVDCGSNTCKVLEARIQAGLDDEFFCFEPQPDLEGSVQEIRRKYPRIPIHFFKSAIWVQDGTAFLYLATKWGPNHKGGSTLLPGHVRNVSEVDYSHPVTVECVDFSRWITKNLSKGDYIVVKMDIEGAEYAVLEKMLADGSIDYIDELIIEFHWQMNDTIGRERHDSLVAALKGRVQITDWH